jgi:3-deoxy-manno-octulosonate cytidylyltransferase (CMP-KDO synthetase)
MHITAPFEMSNFKILDCTLRDGGYYTDWTFDEQLVKNMVKALDENKVDIIELGYKSPVKGGTFRKCNDGYISQLVNFPVKAQLAFMIDVKDFVTGERVNIDLLKDIVHPSGKSPFSVCRVAAKYEEIKYLPEIVRYLQERGYEVACNLMGISTLHNLQIKEFDNTVRPLGLIATYVADSYGAIMPHNVPLIFQELTKPTGIHTHDNLGLALANCLESLQHGVTYVDGTLTGMGRGVGNVLTEQLLMLRNRKITSALLDVLEHFQKLKAQYRWGFNMTYMYAGMNHVHPLYAQDLVGAKLNNTHLLERLSELSHNLNYKEAISEEFLKQTACVIIPARYKSSRFPGKPLALINGKPMVIHVCEKAEQAVGRENVYVATENSEIAEVVKQYGYKVIITSDTCLTGTDRVAEASKEVTADIIVNVQGDEPMIDPQDIIRAIEQKKSNPDHVINCMSKLHRDESSYDKKIPKVVCDLQNNLLYASRNSIPGTKEGEASNIYKQVCIYAFTKTQLSIFESNKKTPLEQEEDIEILRCLEKGIPVRMVEVEKVSYAVDYPEDVLIIEEKLK